MARRLRKRYETRRLRRRYVSSYAEALWRDDCGSTLARRLRKRCGATPVEALMARHLRTRYGETPAEAL